MNKSSPTKTTGGIITLFCIFVGTSVGVCLAALEITGRPQVFRSLAKIVALVNPAEQSEIRWATDSNDLYGTIIETLKSPEMLQKAQKRVDALHPDLKKSEVEIRVAQTKGSGIFNILASGGEPRYTQVLLNALLDEFIVFRRAVREQSQGGDLAAIKDASVVAVQERATTASEHVDDWKLPIIIGGALGALAGLLLGLLISALIAALGKSKSTETA